MSAPPFPPTDAARPAEGRGGRPHRGRSLPSPAAVRPARRSWRDPRLLVGLAIVSACVLAGSRLLATAEETVEVWAVDADLPAGSPVEADDLRSVRLRFASEGLAGRYLPASTPVPGDTVLTRDVAAGELLPRAALGAPEAVGLSEVPIAVPSDSVPAGLRKGELVDVWVTPVQGTGADSEAVRVLEAVHVVAAPLESSALGPATTRQVVVGVPADDSGVLAGALGRLADGAVVLVRRG